MKQHNIRVMTLVSILSILSLSFSSLADAQEYTKDKDAQHATHQSEHGKTNQAPTVSIASLTARLIDAENKAKQKTATVEVSVSGIELIDPAQVNERTKAGQGHIHYQVDDGLVIATTTTKLSFHELSVGPHKIVVMLVGNDHQPLGLAQTLNVTVP